MGTYCELPSNMRMQPTAFGAQDRRFLKWSDAARLGLS